MTGSENIFYIMGLAGQKIFNPSLVESIFDTQLKSLLEYVKAENLNLSYQLTWPLFEAGVILKNTELLQNFVGNIAALYLTTDQSRIDELAGTKRMMEVAQFALPFAQFLYGGKDPSIKAELQKTEAYQILIVPVVEQKIKSDLSAIFSKVLNRNKDTHGQLSNLFSGVDQIAFDECWLFYLATEAYAATNEAKYKDYIDFFLTNARFDSRPPEEFHYSATMNALACYSGMKTLEKLDGYAQKIPSLKLSVAKALLRGYDSNRRPLCDGDGSIIAFDRPVQLEKSCSNVLKTFADNAWASYVFAGENGAVEIR